MSSFLYISATISDSKHSSNMKIIYIQYAYNLNAERERERERERCKYKHILERN